MSGPLERLVRGQLLRKLLSGKLAPGSLQLYWVDMEREGAKSPQPHLPLSCFCRCQINLYSWTQ